MTMTTIEHSLFHKNLTSQSMSNTIRYQNTNHVQIEPWINTWSFRCYSNKYRSKPSVDSHDLVLEKTQDRVRINIQKIANTLISPQDRIPFSEALIADLRKLEKIAADSDFSNLSLVAMELRLTLQNATINTLSPEQIAAFHAAAIEALVSKPYISNPSICWKKLSEHGLSWIPIQSDNFDKKHPAIYEDWPRINDRRCDLIHQDVYGVLSSDEAAELAALQKFTDARMHLLAPLPIDKLDAILDDLKQRGLWEGE